MDDATREQLLGEEEKTAPEALVGAGLFARNMKGLRQLSAVVSSQAQRLLALDAPTPLDPATDPPAGRVTVLDERLAALSARLDTLEAQQGRARVVDALPIDAPLGSLVRLRGDLTGSLYLGNGAARPLTKLVPVAL